MLRWIRCDAFNLQYQLFLCTWSNPNQRVAGRLCCLFIIIFFNINRMYQFAFWREAPPMFYCSFVFLPYFPLSPFSSPLIYLFMIWSRPCAAAPLPWPPCSICPAPACIPKPPLPLPAVSRWRNFLIFQMSTRVLACFCLTDHQLWVCRRWTACTRVK